MEGSGKTGPPAESYKVIPETDLEEQAVSRPKSLLKAKPLSPEVDGADEKMLPEKEDKSNNELAVIAKKSPGTPGSEKQNGDAKLDIGDVKDVFVGLTKQELMKYANDPFWVRLRWFLFLTFWALWLAMLLGAIMIIYAAPKCNPPPPKTWWEEGPLTEIKSDAQSDELKNIKANGIKGVIANWTEDTYADFDETHKFVKFLQEARNLAVNVIVELEPGTSRIWFNHSVHQIGDYTDYYIWRRPVMENNDPKPPNNWVNIENESSWIYNEARKEYYYAPSATRQPHLNLRNANVSEEFTKVLQRFIKYGASGFRLRGVTNLLVDQKFKDEPLNPLAKVHDATYYGSYSHSKTENLADLAPLLKEWRDLVKTDTNNGPFMAAEEIGKNIESYKADGVLLIDLPLRSRVFSKLNPSNIVAALDGVFISDGVSWPSWKYNNSNTLDMVVYLLPGVPLVAENARVDIRINMNLLKFRESPAIMRGSVDYHSIHNNTVFAFIRKKTGNPSVLVAFNPTDSRVDVDFPVEIKSVSPEVTVQLLDSNYNIADIAVNLKRSAYKFPLEANSTIVLTYVESN